MIILIIIIILIWDKFFFLCIENFFKWIELLFSWVEHLIPTLLLTTIVLKPVTYKPDHKSKDLPKSLFV